jgi:hypothetical protein
VAHEIRYIAFDRREVAAMLQAYAAMRGFTAPPGRVIDIVKIEDAIRIVFADENQREATVELDVAAAVSCMLARCRERNYPVAQRFSKHVEVTGNAMVLAMAGPAQALALPSGHR